MDRQKRNNSTEGAPRRIQVLAPERKYDRVAEESQNAYGRAENIFSDLLRMREVQSKSLQPGSRQAGGGEQDVNPFDADRLTSGVKYYEMPVSVCEET